MVFSPCRPLQVFPELFVLLHLLSLGAHGLTALQQELRLTLQRQTSHRNVQTDRSPIGLNGGSSTSCFTFSWSGRGQRT